jgi:hypothetical protein
MLTGRHSHVMACALVNKFSRIARAREAHHATLTHGRDYPFVMYLPNAAIKSTQFDAANRTAASCMICEGPWLFKPLTWDRQARLLSW